MLIWLGVFEMWSVAAHDVGDPVEPVLDRRGEVVERPPVRAENHEVGELFVAELDRPVHEVVPGGHALVGHAETDGALVLVGLSLRDQPVGLGLAALQPVELEGHVAVPFDAEPAERALDLLGRLRDLAVRVRVLDPQPGTRRPAGARRAS